MPSSRAPAIAGRHASMGGQQRGGGGGGGCRSEGINRQADGRLSREAPVARHRGHEMRTDGETTISQDKDGGQKRRRNTQSPGQAEHAVLEGTGLTRTRGRNARRHKRGRSNWVLGRGRHLKAFEIRHPIEWLHLIVSLLLVSAVGRCLLGLPLRGVLVLVCLELGGVLL